MVGLSKSPGPLSALGIVCRRCVLLGFLVGGGKKIIRAYFHCQKKPLWVVIYRAQKISLSPPLWYCQLENQNRKTVSTHTAHHGDTSKAISQGNLPRQTFFWPREWERHRPMEEALPPSGNVPHSVLASSMEELESSGETTVAILVSVVAGSPDLSASSFVILCRRSTKRKRLKGVQHPFWSFQEFLLWTYSKESTKEAPETTMKGATSSCQVSHG